MRGILPDTNGSFTAKIDGKEYAGKNNHATLALNYAKTGVNVLTIESFKTTNALAARQDAHFIFPISFTGNSPQKGNYSFQDVNLRKPFSTNTGVYDCGQNTGGDPTGSTYTFAPARGGNGTITITAINANAVLGTFSGTAINRKKKK